MRWRKNSVKLCWFKHEVLDEYLKHPERYHIYDERAGMCNILTKDAYYFNLPEDERDSETFAQIRYFKRRLKNSELAIGVVEHDLSQLPYKEQLYWTSKEIENPEFMPHDENFEKSTKEGFEGEFVNHNDPLQSIYEIIKAINVTLENKLFKNDTQNPNLRYPVVNTEQSYQNAHEELFKLIGSDSLNKKALEEILLKKLGVSEDKLKDKKSKRPKGPWALFKILISKIPEASFAPFKKCYDARIAKTHKIDEARLPDKDFTKMFLDDCSNIVKELKRLKSFLESIF